MEYPHPQYISAAAYKALDRGDSKALPDVRRELDRVINAQPTQLHPDQRTEFLVAILDDLRPGGVWSLWPEDVHTQALVAVKVLGRNPVGSGEILLKKETLNTLVSHTCLSFPGRGQGFDEAVQAAQPPALEALRVLANTLVLHPVARKKLSRAGAAEAVARALSDKLSADRLFILCRIGFLVTANGSGVQELVDQEHIVPRLVYHLHATHPIPSHYDALSELLKFTGNIVRCYPRTGPDEWDSVLNPLLYPILCIVYNLQFNDLVPPLTHALNALLSIPFTNDLLPTWYAVPTPATEGMRKKSQSKSLFGRRKGSPKELSPVHSRQGSAADGLHPQSPTMSRSPSPTPSDDHTRAHLTPRTNDPHALPRRILTILNGFVDSHLPGGGEPQTDIPLDEILPPVLLLAAYAANGSSDMRTELRAGLLPSDLDRSQQAGPLETRPGLLGTLLRFMNGHTYRHCRDTAGELIWAVCGGDGTVCDEVGYGNAAGLLFRKGISGPPPARVREVSEPSRSAGHLSSKHTSKPSPTSRAPSKGTLGNTSRPVSGSAGLPPRPPPLGPLPSPPMGPLPPIPRANVPTAERHPITSLQTHDDGKSPFAGMTAEEKEREAEKLFVLFDRLERNPVIKAGAPTADGAGTQSLRAAMADKVAEGVADEWEQQDAEQERIDAEREADEIEAEAMRELAEYRRRMGRY